MLSMLHNNDFELLERYIWGEYNFLHMFCDHRKGLHKRLSFVNTRYFIASEFKMCVEKYNIISVIVEKIRLLYIKTQILVGFKEQRHFDIALIAKNVSKLIMYADELYILEFNVLDEICSCIENISYKQKET